MKKILCVLPLIFLAGCWFDSGEASTEKTSDRCVIKTGRYVLDKLPTSTPEQDKAFIKAIYADVNALDAAIRGSVANQATQALVAGSPVKPVVSAPVAAPVQAPAQGAPKGK